MTKLHNEMQGMDALAFPHAFHSPLALAGDIIIILILIITPRTYARGEAIGLSVVRLLSLLLSLLLA